MLELLRFVIVRASIANSYFFIIRRTTFIFHKFAKLLPIATENVATLFNFSGHIAYVMMSTSILTISAMNAKNTMPF